VLTIGNFLASSNKSKKKKNKKKNAGAKSESNGDATPDNGVKDGTGVEEDADDGEPSTPIEPAATPNEPYSHTPEEQSNLHVNGVGGDATERLDALAKERDALRSEVSELRKSLEALTTKHEEEVNGLREQLEETQSGKEDAESKYEDLRERVTTIRSTLGERLKEYSVWWRFMFRI
jgi:DNA repair exonuclease SbcCD ATPase subunit